MATATTSTPCFTCGKERGRVRCEGCSKVFCLSDFASHQQELSKQLEEVEATRDLFRQSLTEKIDTPLKHALIERIDKWENESITKIQQAARKARQIILQHTTQLNTELEEKLNKLTDELRRSREAKDFFETELNQWREELTQMSNQLIKPPRVIIQHLPTPLIRTMTVEISDVTSNIQPNKETHVSARDDSVFCSFCNEQLPSPAAMGEHLMMCGNKTDECPNCHKFIRRAILAYHRTNSCANPDDETTDRATGQRMPSSRGGQRLIERPSFDTANKVKRAESYDEKNSIPNSKNVVNTKQQPMYKNSNQGLNRSNEFDDDAKIPCEYCNETIPLHLYEDHAKHCRDEEEIQRRPWAVNLKRQFASHNVSKATPTGIDQCKWCGKSSLENSLLLHQLTCEKNPHHTKK